jgi:uncharacterized protein YbjT (DUF2867 family)
MKFAVLGATGATGQLFTTAALAAGHEVSALVRSPEKLPKRPGLTAVVGDARDADAVSRTMQGADALVSTIGSGSSRNPNNLIVETTRAILSAAGQSALRRIVMQSAFGVGDSYPKASFLMHLGYRLAPKLFIDKAAGEKLLRASDLDWTIVYPGVLTNKPKTGNVTASDLTEVPRIPGMPRISRADVADFLLHAATHDSWTRRVTVITTHK